jgi:lysophospholipase L1-like esterase
LSRNRLLHRLATTALAAALLLTWISVLVYHFTLSPLQRQSLQLRIGGLIYAPGPAVLIGDSLMTGLVPPCNLVINLASPGARVDHLGGEFANAVASRKPSKILIMIGVNDLRSGNSPQMVADRILMFVKTLRDKTDNATITVISILPIVEVGPPDVIRNIDIGLTNQLLRRNISREGVSFVDISGMFGNEALWPSLTYDGLHLNARGQALLSNVLFNGLAGAARLASGDCKQ